VELGVPAIRLRLSAPSAQAVIASLARVARAVMRQLEAHLAVFVEADSDALVLLLRALADGRGRCFSRRVSGPARGRAGLPQITFRGLRQSFVAILVVARCNVREVSEWAGQQRCLHVDAIRLAPRRRLGRGISARRSGRARVRPKHRPGREVAVSRRRCRVAAEGQAMQRRDGQGNRRRLVMQVSRGSPPERAPFRCPTAAG
jgi:hypothetical protein